jgi:hypothetical protein
MREIIRKQFKAGAIDAMEMTDDEESDDTMDTPENEQLTLSK